MSVGASIVLRPVVAGDADFLRRLFFDARRSEFAPLSWPTPLLEQLLYTQFELQRRHYAAAYPQADHHLIVIGDRSIGQLCVARGRDELRLVDISLMPEVRSRGIGTQLIRTLQVEASGRGVPVRLSVLRGNPAERLYSRLGFTLYADEEPYRELEWLPGAG